MTGGVEAILKVGLAESWQMEDENQRLIIVRGGSVLEMAKS